MTSFIAHILDMMEDVTQHPETTPTNSTAQPLIDPLTEREQDILPLLCQRLTNKEIAKDLQISPHTVHSHIKNIYTKLDVNNRRQAANRAQELGLVTPN